MKILNVQALAIPDVKVLKYQRFADNRGYFTETFRWGDIKKDPRTGFLHNIQFEQANESFSKKGTIRGLHFQWNPYMGKLVRTITGRMIDMALDVRLNSPTFGKIIMYDLPASPNDQIGEWLWIPVGFAHGLLFPEDGMIEYFCTGGWAPKTEASISPLDNTIDWSLADPELKKLFDKIAGDNPLISQKDLDGYTIGDWQKNPDSNNFVYPD